MRERRNKRESTNSGKDSHKILRAIAFSCLVGALVLAAVLLVFSLILSSKNIPHIAITPMVIFAMILSGGAAGFTCARILREKGLMYGAICGLIMGLVLMAVGTMMDQAFYCPTIPQMMLLLFSGMIGGVMGVNVRMK